MRDHPRTAVRSCHGAGKSYIAARIALWFLNSFPYSLVLTTAPTFRQVAKVTWQEIRSAHKRSRFPLGGKLLETAIQVDEKWFALGFSAKDPDHFQGLHSTHVLVILEEGAGIELPIWVAADAVLTSQYCRLLSIGNPTDNTGQFYKEFKDPNVYKMKISAYDTPNFQGNGIVVPGLITPDWVEDKKKRWGETSPFFVTRVLADFHELNDNTLIPLSWIEFAVNNETDEVDNGHNTLGVDVARYGSNETVIYHSKGNKLRLASVTNKQDTMATVGLIVKLGIELGVKEVRIDDSGVGGGVTDRLRELKREGRIHFKVVAVNVGTSSVEGEAENVSDKRFINLRAQLYWHLRDEFEAKILDMGIDEETMSQLSCIQYKLLSSGKLQIETKDEMTRRNLPSPDRADAAMLARAPSALLQGGAELELW